MQRSTIREAADRIRQMELCFDVLQKLAEDESSATANPWFRGFFRILAQDALYDFLERMKG